MVDGRTFGNFDEWIAEHDKAIKNKMIEDAEKLLDKIAPDKVTEIKCDDGEIRNRPLIDVARVYEILEQVKEAETESNAIRKFAEWLVETVYFDCDDCDHVSGCMDGNTACVDNLLNAYEKEQKEGAT